MALPLASSFCESTCWTREAMSPSHQHPPAHMTMAFQQRSTFKHPGSAPVARGRRAPRLFNSAPSGGCQQAHWPRAHWRIGKIAIASRIPLRCATCLRHWFGVDQVPGGRGQHGHGTDSPRAVLQNDAGPLPRFERRRRGGDGPAAHLAVRAGRGPRSDPRDGERQLLAGRERVGRCGHTSFSGRRQRSISHQSPRIEHRRRTGDRFARARGSAELSQRRGAWQHAVSQSSARQQVGCVGLRRGILPAHEHHGEPFRQPRIGHDPRAGIGLAECSEQQQQQQQQQASPAASWTTCTEACFPVQAGSLSWTHRTLSRSALRSPFSISSAF